MCDKNKKNEMKCLIHNNLKILNTKMNLILYLKTILQSVMPTARLRAC